MKFPAVALGFAISIALTNAETGDLTHYNPGTGMSQLRNAPLPCATHLYHLLSFHVQLVTSTLSSLITDSADHQNLTRILRHHQPEWRRHRRPLYSLDGQPRQPK